MKLIFDYDQQITGHIQDDPEPLDLPKDLSRENLPLPNVNEIDVVRHFTKPATKVTVLGFEMIFFFAAFTA